MTELFLIIGMMIVTFLPRMLPLLLASRLQLPASIELALNYVPIAVLTVIITQTVFYQQGTLNVSLTNPYLWASAAAMTISLVQTRLIITISGGLMVFTLVKYFI